ncbi:iron-sulfur clusters transporter ABCB7, mitochondrial, partial [Tachysurus ichikawai]
MAPLLVPVRCGYHIQRRNLALLLQRSSSYPAWSYSRKCGAAEFKRKHRSTYE